MEYLNFFMLKLKKSKMWESISISRLEKNSNLLLELLSLHQINQYAEIKIRLNSYITRVLVNKTDNHRFQSAIPLGKRFSYIHMCFLRLTNERTLSVISHLGFLRYFDF